MLPQPKMYSKFAPTYADTKKGKSRRLARIKLCSVLQSNTFFSPTFLRPTTIFYHNIGIVNNVDSLALNFAPLVITVSSPPLLLLPRYTSV